jgi:hypothetical protein
MKRKLLIIPMLFIAIAMMAEKALTIIPLSGADEQHAVSLIGQIRFTGDVMYLYDATDSELGHTPLSEIGKIVFCEKSEIPTSMDNVHSSSVQVFPNPTHDYLIVQGLESNQSARVFSLNGQLISTTPISTTETKINVSDLPNGSYLLQVGAEIVKFIKK